MAKFKKPLLFALCLIPLALIAGAFVALYQLDIYGDALPMGEIEAIGGVPVLIAVSAVQSAAYAFVGGFFGYILAGKVGLWKPLRLDRRAWAVTVGVSVAGGIVFSLDHWTFGSAIDGIQAANAASLTVQGVFASVLYGGIVEEILLRLFFLSLLAVIFNRVFCKNAEQTPRGVFIAANIVAALLFAAGHLPATALLFGSLTPLVLIRCFLLNGGFGLLLGWLYRKYGIAAAIVSHALLHIVCKVILFLFI